MNNELKLEVGSKFRYDDRLYYVLGIFDDDHVAVKFYGLHKQWWHYVFFSMYELDIYYKSGKLVVKK